MMRIKPRTRPPELTGALRPLRAGHLLQRQRAGGFRAAVRRATVSFVGRECIEKMIAEALAAAEDEAKRPRLIHGEHILEQYVKVYGDGDAPSEEAIVEIVLPAPQAERTRSPPQTIPLGARAVGRAISRLKR